MAVSYHANDKLQWVNISSTAATGLSSLLFLADVGSVHNFHFEFLERPQLIPFVRAKVSLCFYDDLLTSPKS